MKIIALQAENVKRLSAVEIKPDGNLVVVAGKNGAGKTSVLDSISWAIEGASHIQAEPIRKGAKKAKIRLDLGELIVTRTFSKAKDGEKTTTSLSVESPDGALFRSPQKVLDELLGSLSFDPLGFARAKPAEQVDMLRTLVPDFDFDEADRLNAADYEKRRDVNRRAKELKSVADSIELPDIDFTRIDETALVEELEKAGKHNADIETRKANRGRLERDAGDLVDEADRLDARAAELRKQADEIEKAALEKRAESTDLLEKLASAEALPDPIDTAKIRERISQAREKNELVDERDRKQALEKEVAELEAESEALSESMDERKTAKAKAIAAANLPVPGLAFGAGEVTLAGVPFDQGSDAEQLRASVAIAAALNPKLRVIRIRDGSLLDEDGMKILAELADAQDMQVWIERVDSSGKVGFVIADGHLAGEETGEAAA